MLVRQNPGVNDHLLQRLGRGGDHRPHICGRALPLKNSGEISKLLGIRVGAFRKFFQGQLLVLTAQNGHQIQKSTGKDVGNHIGRLQANGRRHILRSLFGRWREEDPLLKPDMGWRNAQ